MNIVIPKTIAAMSSAVIEGVVLERAEQ